MKEQFNLKWDKNFWIKNDKKFYNRFVIVVKGEEHSPKMLSSFIKLEEAKSHAEKMIQYFETSNEATYFGPLYDGCDVFVRDLETGEEWISSGRDFWKRVESI